MEVGGWGGGSGWVRGRGGGVRLGFEIWVSKMKVCWGAGGRAQYLPRSNYKEAQSMLRKTIVSALEESPSNAEPSLSKH